MNQYLVKIEYFIYETQTKCRLITGSCVTHHDKCHAYYAQAQSVLHLSAALST
jgi:hypothetical protein